MFGCGILLSMLADKDTVTSYKDVDRILVLRGEQDHGNDQPRLFLVPQLQFNAKS